MAANSTNKGLIIAIIFASAVISGSLVFFGMQAFGGSNDVVNGLSEEELQTKIIDGIDVYVKNQQAEAARLAEEANKPRLVKGDFTDDDAVLGDEDAPVTMVEFSDYECPLCGRFFRETLPQIKEKYIDTGKVKLVYRDYPLSYHPQAYPAALFAECVRDQSDDEAYFKVHDRIFTDMAAGGLDFDGLSTFASTLGVDKSKLKTCVENEKFKEEIYADQEEGSEAGIDGTPGFIVNGWLISGAQPFAIFEAEIERELAEAE